MVRRTRAEMEETRAILLATARQIFSERGYAATSMDDLTAQAGLTRGALYHHFGDKKGLLIAVVEQIDAETDARLEAAFNRADNPWQGFRNRCHAYLEMAMEPEIQRILLRDSRAVLGGTLPDSHRYCLDSMQQRLSALIQQGVIVEASPQALASMIYGSLAEAAFWIASVEDGNTRLTQAKITLELLLNGLLKKA